MKTENVPIWRDHLYLYGQVNIWTLNVLSNTRTWVEPPCAFTKFFKYGHSSEGDSKIKTMNKVIHDQQASKSIENRRQFFSKTYANLLLESTCQSLPYNVQLHPLEFPKDPRNLSINDRKWDDKLNACKSIFMYWANEQQQEVKDAVKNLCVWLLCSSLIFIFVVG